MLIDRLPAPLHRWLLRQAQPWRLRIWGLLGRQIEGIMVLAFAPDGRMLLVRHSYHLPDTWLLPGGGGARGEDPPTTAQREVHEETGCTLHDPVLLDHVLRTMPQGWTNRIAVVAGQISGTPRADGREIAAVGLFAPDNLPPNTSASVHEFLALRAASKR